VVVEHVVLELALRVGGLLVVLLRSAFLVLVARVEAAGMRTVLAPRASALANSA
jgi:hypothetical protein